MGSSDHTQEDELKLIEEKLLTIGKKFENLPANKDELLALLEEGESVLCTVYQNPPKSTQEALLPLTKALIRDEIFKNTDADIKLQVAALVNELARATAPLPPYPARFMKECFKLFLVAFKHLRGQSEKGYIKALRILKTMALVRTILILMDLEDSEALMGEMLRRFFVTIRSNPYPLMIECVEKVVNIVIENSKDFSMSILMPLLASVEMNNKDISPATWNLGKRIFQKNATKLQCWLKEANREMQLSVDDYDEIVSSLLRHSSHAEIATTKDATETDRNENFKDGENSFTDVMQRQDNASDCDNFLETWSCCEQMVQLRANDSTSNMEVENCAQNPQPKTATGSNRRKRTVKRHSLISPDEGYENPLTAVGKFCDQLLSDFGNRKKKDMVLHSKHGKTKASDSSQKELNSIIEANPPKKSTSKRKSKLQGNVVEPSPKARNVSDSKSKDEVSSVLKKKKKVAKNTISGLNETPKGSVKKGKRVRDDTQRGEDDIPLEEKSGAQEVRDEMIIEKDESKDADKKVVGSEISSAATKKHKEKSKSLAPEKGKKPKKVFGEDLVNMRIKVWWPIDKTFYTGTVQSYDILTKKHKIIYDDDEEEVLNLKTEKWEPFLEKQQLSAAIPYKKPETDRRPSPPKEPIKAQKTSSKKGIGSFKKSKKSTSESHDKGKSKDDDESRSLKEDVISDRPAKKTRKSSLDFHNANAPTSEFEAQLS